MPIRPNLSWRILAGAEAAGIGLTLMPVLYQASQLGGAPPTEGQRRFILDDDTFAPRSRGGGVAGDADNPDWRMGIAPHSLRAVTPAALDRVVALARALDPAMPIHIHAAEQVKEVEDCLAWSGRRPVEWLLDHGAGHRLVPHPLHPYDRGRAPPARRERRGGRPLPDDRGQSRRRLLPDPRFRRRGRRLRHRHRFQRLDQPGRGTALARIWLPAAAPRPQRRRDAARRLGRRLAGVARARGRRQRRSAGRSARSRPGGGRISWCSTPDHPALVGRPLDRVLDAFVFNGNETPVSDVMVGGRWVVKDRVHVAEAPIRAAFAKTMKRLEATL